MKILVACEESQRVCIAFRNKGHEAYSCDIVMCSGGCPQWHIWADVEPLLNGGTFRTCDSQSHTVDKWDMIIALFTKNCLQFLAVAQKTTIETPRIGLKSDEPQKPREAKQNRG